MSKAGQALEQLGLRPSVMVDCSHANSEKDHRRQPVVAEDLARQVSAGSRAVFGIMIESFLCEAGRIKSPAFPSPTARASPTRASAGIRAARCSKSSPKR